MAKILTPVDLRDIFMALQAIGLDAIVVGGQAVNLCGSINTSIGV